MDHARKIGKSSEKSLSRDPWSYKSSSCTQIPRLCKTSNVLNEPTIEDKCSANWNRWLVDRQRREKYLSTVLGRKPLDLVLNSHEKVRGKNELRCLMQAAVRSEITNQDKYRGNPAFWRKVNRLVVEQDETDDNIDDIIVRDDTDVRNLPPNVTRVALPNFIKREKMLVESCVDPSKIDLASKWECGDYFRQRKSELSKELKFLEKKKPETEELIVLGNNFPCHREKKLDNVRVPVITITPPEIEKQLLNSPDDRIALKIQNREFVFEKGYYFERLSVEESRKIQEAKKDRDDEKYAYSSFELDRIYEIIDKKSPNVSLSLTFETIGNEISTKNLVLENSGVFVVNVHWFKQPDPFAPFPIPEKFDSPFFFNKNHSSILPGQRLKIPFWFRSERPVTNSETWELMTNPKIYPGKIYLRLWGSSHGQALKDRQRDDYDFVKNCLAIRLRNSMVRKIVNEIVNIATSQRRPDYGLPYENFFVESQVFQARNPTYQYHSDLIKELKKIFVKVTDRDPKSWNLSLLELRSFLLKIDDSPTRRKLSERFREICFASLRPNNLHEFDCPSNKKLVYNLLCGFFNGFEDESGYIFKAITLEKENFYHENEEDDASDEIFCMTSENIDIYREVFFTRIRFLLADTLSKIGPVLESNNYLNTKHFHSS